MLQGYDKLDRLTDRRNFYIEQACGVNENVRPTWLSDNKKRQADNLRAEEDAYFIRLAEKLLQTGHVGELGLFTEVLQDLRTQYPAGIPEEVALPAPRYVQDAGTIYSDISLLLLFSDCQCGCFSGRASRRKYHSEHLGVNL